MDHRAASRIGDIKQSISAIRDLLSGRSQDEVKDDRVARAALERFLEIASEASRHVPDAWKAEYPEIPWRRVADIGNVIRHAYDHVDLGTLWGIYERDLTPLERALDEMLAVRMQEGGSG